MKSPQSLFFLLLLFAGFAQPVAAQTLTQTIRGQVTDHVTRSPLPGATVLIIGSDPVVGTTTDPDGNFKLPPVPVGNYHLKISFVGYQDRVVPNIVVNSGKEVVLTLALEEDITQMEEVVISAESHIEKNKPLNDMAVVSARTFSVDETRKFAAAVNDPARMVASYAGVVQTSDGNNSISVRGNSPFGLLWRMEGVDIPNPNHFANVATSGGGISIISSQLLTNSDFMTGAFTAEYGNALAGVFDLNLRKGNNEKREYTVQAGFLGTDVAAEGPLAKNYKGSFLVNYRYSTLAILSNLGVQVGGAATNFQDLSYNIYLPSKWGNFSLFGFGGLSDQTVKAKADSSEWTDEYYRYNSTYFSNTGAAGAKHSLNLGANTFLQTTLVFSGNSHGFEQDRLDEEYVPQFDYRQNFVNRKLTLSSVLNHKFSARHAVRTGFYGNRYYFDLTKRFLDHETRQIETPLQASGAATTWQLFGQWSFRASKQVTLNAGLHTLWLTTNGSLSLEPRLSAKWDLSERQSLSVGYGLHSQMQPVGVYQASVTDPSGVQRQPNRHLGFNKAHHYVLAYDQSLSPHLRVKAETYYQQLFNIAVEDDLTSSLSTINNEEGYITDPLVNQGAGRNYGLELTLEHFLHNNLYFLISGSLYQSEYRALDNVWRNTRFNANRALSVTAGKEFPLAKERTLGINLRTIYTGGLRTTPIDVEASKTAGETRYMESLAFTDQLPDYFRTDLRFSLKRNKLKSTRTWSLDIQNVTNHQNLGGQYYDVRTAEVKKWYQLPLLPVLSYRVEF